MCSCEFSLSSCNWVQTIKIRSNSSNGIHKIRTHEELNNKLVNLIEIELRNQREPWGWMSEWNPLTNPYVPQKWMNRRLGAWKPYPSPWQRLEGDGCGWGLGVWVNEKLGVTFRNTKVVIGLNNRGIIGTKYIEKDSNPIKIIFL